MRKFIGVLGVGAALLAGACDVPGTSGKGSDVLATVNLSLAPALPLKTVSAYRTAAGSTAHVTDFTPSRYRTKFRQIALYTENFTLQPLYQGKDPLELSNKDAFEAALNETLIPVPPGTYVGIQVEPDAAAEIAGQATLGTTPLFTRTSLSADPTVGPAEPVNVTVSDAKRNIAFAKPLVIKEGDAVSLSVLYDLTASANFYASGNGMTQYASGHGLLAKSYPLFAFVGEPPRPEVYRIRIDDPEHRLAPSSSWYFHTLLFAGTDGGILGIQSSGRLEAGYDGTEFNRFSFVDRGEKARRNADGTYHLEGHPNPANVPQYVIEAFKRETHDGSVRYATQTGEPLDLVYHAEKL